jgi:hypothetical protein
MMKTIAEILEAHPDCDRWSADDNPERLTSDSLIDIVENCLNGTCVDSWPRTVEVYGYRPVELGPPPSSSGWDPGIVLASIGAYVGACTEEVDVAQFVRTCCPEWLDEPDGEVREVVERMEREVRGG